MKMERNKTCQEQLTSYLLPWGMAGELFMLVTASAVWSSQVK